MCVKYLMAIAACRLINGCILAHHAEITSTDQEWWSPTSPKKMMGNHLEDGGVSFLLK